MKVNCITINTDASWHPQKKVGGYAFYIVCDFFRITKSGKFKDKPQTPMEAEMWCIANALATLAAQKEIPKTQLIVINSDCLYAFQNIGRKSKYESGKKIWQILKAIKKRTSTNTVLTRHEFRHVKAHNGTPDKRS